MNPTTHMLIQSYFKQLKMPQASKVYQSMAREAEDNNLSYEEYLLGVLEQEITQRKAIVYSVGYGRLTSLSSKPWTVLTSRPYHP